MNRYAPARASSEAQLPREARVAVEVRFGSRVHAWITAAGAQVKSTAENSLGLSRNDLNDALQGAKHFRAAWLELLPPAVELLYLKERAAAHLMELRAASTCEETFAEAIAAFGACLTSCGQTEADGYVDPDECLRDLAALELLEQHIANVKAHRRAVLAERGRMIRAVTPGAGT